LPGLRDVAILSIPSLRGPQARGNPDGLSASFAIFATEPPSGLPRRYAPCNDGAGGERAGFPSFLIAPPAKH
jgi:hypothetical protein